MPPPQDAVSMTPPMMRHATIAGSTRRALLKFPKKRPAIPKEKIQLAYATPLVRLERFFAVVAELVIFNVEVAVPLPSLRVEGEKEHIRFAGRKSQESARLPAFKSAVAAALTVTCPDWPLVIVSVVGDAVSDGDCDGVGDGDGAGGVGAAPPQAGL